MSQSRGRPFGGPVSCCGGPLLEELSGGKWMTELGGLSLTGVSNSTGRTGYFGTRPCLVLKTNFFPLRGVSRGVPAASSREAPGTRRAR